MWGATQCYTSVAAFYISFNPRSPCGERPSGFFISLPSFAFQSTLPVWGATMLRARSLPKGYVSIHAPRVGSDQAVGSRIYQMSRFQSTLPVWGATPMESIQTSLFGFQSTLPVWGATVQGGRGWELYRVSIHAPRVGSDRADDNQRFTESAFQSTLPVWGATALSAGRLSRVWVPIHAPRVGSDQADGD